MGKISQKMVRGLKPWDERNEERKKARDTYIELKKDEIQRQIVKECNFKPQINKKSQMLQKNTTSVERIARC